MDLTNYRQSDLERQRTDDLLNLVRQVPVPRAHALDIGARDGFFSELLADRFDAVTALDLSSPKIAHDRITCVQGDITGLEFADNAFDLVFCAEVLEHIPPSLLEQAASELTRVSRKSVLIGVPFKQDIRVGRTTCLTCGGKNPPWGHVNSFDEQRLFRLFPDCEVKAVSFVGQNTSRTNVVSALLMDMAGNPYGTYEQEEECVHCGARLKRPPERTLIKKVLTKIAFVLRGLQKPFVRAHPNWIHVLFEKQGR
jgi:ubiquinone/menaquinone biosynthesis C-methylase UbiE